MSLLEVKNLTKTFGGLTAVDDLTFNIEKDEILSLIGPNGAGKTTTFNMITGFLNPDRGKIIFNDIDITSKEPHNIAELGLIRTFQKTNIFPDATVYENIKLAHFKSSKYSILDILIRNKKFNKTEKRIKEKTNEIMEYFNLSEEKDKKAYNLAYGRKRILEIAIGMAASPKLLLLDEPVAGLNPKESKEVMELIYDIRNKGITILLVEHDMSVVTNVSDRIVVINFGEKICDGDCEYVTSDEEVIKAYLGDDIDA